MARGCPLSPIDGMPIGIKDIIETADFPTKNGSPIYFGWRSERDGASVAALREAGAVILGKTVTTEFAATEPRGTRNPHSKNSYDSFHSMRTGKNLARLRELYKNLAISQRELDQAASDQQTAKAICRPRCQQEARLPQPPS